MVKNSVCCYWEGSKPPAYLSLCVSSWLDYLDLDDVVIINQSNAHRYIGDFFDIKNLKMYSFAKQSDIVSAAYLTKFGGTFIDIDTIMINERCNNFLENDSSRDVLKLFGNHATGGMHIGALSTPARGRLISYWAEKLLDRVPEWEFDNSWAYVGNQIIEPYAKLSENSEYLEVLDVSDLLVTPELQAIEDSSLNSRQKYEKFWFSELNSENKKFIDQLISDGGGIISLHNSWTPEFYADMSVDQILNDNRCLSYLFSQKADFSKVAEIEELLAYGS